jgi:ATP-dependent 26S proteasome regulatory subunit
MKSTLDPAFVRWLRFIVDFPYPGIDELISQWKRVFPKETKTDGLDYEGLSRINLTGGSIHNIAINAAFLAANEGSAVSMKQVLDAAKTEFRKAEKSIIESDFRL